MVIHLGSNDYGHGGPWSNTTSGHAALGPGARSFVEQLVALMLNATRSYRSPNITFFLPTGPMVNDTMAATLTAVQQGRASLSLSLSLSLSVCVCVCLCLCVSVSVCVYSRY